MSKATVEQTPSSRPRDRWLVAAVTSLVLVMVGLVVAAVIALSGPTTMAAELPVIGLSSLFFVLGFVAFLISTMRAGKRA